MRIWYKLKKQKANNQRKFGAKNREAERELAAFLIPFCLGCGWWLEVTDSAPQCLLPATHQWKPPCHSDVSQEVSGGPTEGAYSGKPRPIDPPLFLLRSGKESRASEERFLLFT